MIKNIKIAFLILSTCFCLPLSAHVEYNIVPLVPPGYKPGSNIEFDAKVNDLSETGYVVGYGTKKWPVTVGFVYTPDGDYDYVAGTLENADVVPIKVNNNGIIVGLANKYEWDFNENGASCSWDKTVFVFDSMNRLYYDLSTLEDTRSYETPLNILGITDEGKVLVTTWNYLEMKSQGYIYDVSSGAVLGELSHEPIAINNNGTVIGKTWYYTPEDGIKYLGSLDPYKRWNVRAAVINDRGVIAGRGKDVQKSNKGFIWDIKNGFSEFPTLGGKTIQISDINNLSQVVGSSENKNLNSHAFLYTPSKKMFDLGTLGGKDSFANSINDHSQVVGFSESSSKAERKRAFVWDAKHGMRDLNTLIPRNSGWKILEEAYKINNQGYIIGRGKYLGEESSFLLIPKKNKRDTDD